MEMFDSEKVGREAEMVQDSIPSTSSELHKHLELESDTPQVNLNNVFEHREGKQKNNQKFKSKIKKRVKYTKDNDDEKSDISTGDVDLSLEKSELEVS